MVRAPALPSFFQPVYFETVGSTMDEVRARAEQGVGEGLLIWAGEQTAGRGRRGRGFQSPPGNLYFSLLLRPDCAAAEGAQLGFVAALAMAEAVARFLPDPARLGLKWPNDLLIDRRKAAGLLLEGLPGPGGRLAGAILGIGTNLQHFPEGLPFPATSLAAAGAQVEAGALLSAFAERFAVCYESWRREGFAPIRRDWLARAVGLGEMIEVRLDRETLRGRFAALDEAGRLRLDLEGGGQRIVSAGDVFFPDLDP